MRVTKWLDDGREAPEPLEGDPVAVAAVGTVVWFALFVAQLPFYGWYADHGHDWWIWTCLTGGVLGLLGLVYVRRRQAAPRRLGDATAGDDADGGAPREAPED